MSANQEEDKKSVTTDGGAHINLKVKGHGTVESISKSLQPKMKFSSKNQFEVGVVVEVKSKEKAHYGSWYCARIESLLGDDTYIVEHLRFKGYYDEFTPVRDVVEAQNIRPVPPERSTQFRPQDKVDVWYNKRWWIGRVLKVQESKCVINLFSTGEELIVLQFNLRLHKIWKNGQWFNPTKVVESKTMLKKCKPSVCANQCFKTGMMVEVKTDEEGYEDSWYPAKIVSYLGEDKYFLEYQTLKTEDERELLKEKVRGSDIRPTPTFTQKSYGYELNEYVDAWYNDGWWSGQVYKIIGNNKWYGVYFKTTSEKLLFAYNDLRSCQLWVKGKWFHADEVYKQ